MNTRIERTENCPAVEGSNGLLGHPDDVVRDPGMTLDEKRAVLAAWASDAHMVENNMAVNARDAMDGQGQITITVGDTTEIPPHVHIPDAAAIL